MQPFFLSQLGDLLPGSAAIDRGSGLAALGQILALETIIANHRHQHPSDQLLEAELEFEQGRYVYELKMLGSDGVVREFEYNARSGELWRVERDR